MHFFSVKIFKQYKSLFVLALLTFQNIPINAQRNDLMKSAITEAILKSTKYFDEKVSVNGGYVWYYTPDLSRRWGEMEAYPTMVWIQGEGTVAMGNIFLDIYDATQNEYYYSLAEKSAQALTKGQLDCGGWNYLIDFAGEESIKKWYDTIGKNGWRLEEFQHYYGNATFDDAATPGAATFLLRVYLTKQNPEIKTALDKAIKFILESQYPLGGWPQRFPFKENFNKNGNPDYTPYYTFNDNAIWNNIKFLISCYLTLHEEKFLNPIKRAMNFFLLTQQSKPQAGWSMQYSLDLKPAAARTYEPKALDPQYTARHIEILMKFYELTGDEKFLSRIPAALEWINSVKISETPEGFCQVPKFIELETNKTLFTHRIGTNVKCGKYFFDYESKNDLLHYQSIRTINLKQLYEGFAEVKSSSEKEITNEDIFVPGIDDDKHASVNLKTIDEFLNLKSEIFNWRNRLDSNFVKRIISIQDNEGRWLDTRAFISNPYIGEPECTDSETKIYSHTRVGDKYDTSPYENASDQKYISTGIYIRNVRILLEFLKQIKAE